MRRPLVLVCVGVALLAAASSVLAAPLAQERRPVIAQPEADAAVRGVVQIVGSATHPQFQRYELYYAPWPVPSDQAWIFIGDAHFQQQPLGLLGTWPTGSLPDGAYGLRVRVVKVDGNYIDSETRRVVVANRRAPDTPTPAATSTPATPPTAAPPTATVAVIVPTVQVARPTATPAVQISSTPILAAGGSASGAAGAVDQILDVGRLRTAAERAATYTLAAFALVAAFFMVKGLLVWLWHKVRP